MSLLLLTLFIVGGSIAALALTSKSGKAVGTAVIATSIALSVAIFFGITSGLTEYPRGVVMVAGIIISTLVLLVGCAIGIGALEASTADPRSPIFDVLIGTLVLGLHIFLGSHFLRGSYGVVHLLWDAFGVFALGRGAYRLRRIRKPARIPKNDA